MGLYIPGIEPPPLLIELIEQNRWVHPGNEVLREKIPFIKEELLFLTSIDEMIRNSPYYWVPGDEEISLMEYRGSRTGPRDLPWLDAELSLLLIDNKHIGHDLAICLDYRTGLETPRVVGTEWIKPDSASYQPTAPLYYREITSTLEAFVELLGL
ncbi:MAG: hypothetical protein R3C11_14495 [Planctomycetaceae bacterium]